MADPAQENQDDGQAPESSLAAAFRAGERLGSDPLNRRISDGPAITGERSQWLLSYCQVCFHNFRQDDAVLIRTDQEGRLVGVVHNPAVSSWCTGGTPDAAGADVSEVGRDFFAGIDSEDPPKVSHVRRLSPGDELVQLREVHRDRDRRRHCFMCTLTFRPHELVIECVCYPGAPSRNQCKLAVHRDAAHNLLCYERYLANIRHKRVRQCPTDGHIPEQS
jgi:hypothetical protein